MTHAAALAFYTSLSLPPLVLLLLWAVGLLGADGADLLRAEATSLVGADGGQLVDTILASADARAGLGGPSAVLGTAALAFAASGIFAQLQSALNEVWDVMARPGAGIRGWARKRFLSMGLVGVVAFLALVSLVASAAVRSVGVVESGGYWASALNAAVSLGVFSLLFAAVFKLLPDVSIRWRDMWIGAALTSLLFSAGKALIGFYLVAKGTGAEYGSAGSVIVVLAWVYFTSVLVLFGSELTQAWLFERGRRPEPNEHAVRVVRIVGDERPGLPTTPSP